MARRDRRTGFLTRVRQLMSRHCFLISGQLYGNYLSCCYVVVKLLYCVNAVGQVFLLDVLLGYDYHVLGVNVIKHLLFGDKWIPSERPVIVCSVNCRTLQLITDSHALLSVVFCLILKRGHWFSS